MLLLLANLSRSRIESKDLSASPLSYTVCEPSQILLNNLLYDTSQIAIPGDNEYPSFSKKPRHWNISLLRNFMIFIGPLGFTPLPGLYFLFLIAMTLTYLVLVALVKRPLMRKYAN